MKLTKVYANYSEFKNIKFNERFNVILGVVTDKSIEDTDTHNLGKTLLITIIEFVLLKDIDKKKHIFNHKVFNGKVFFCEILLNNGKYLIIRRSVDNQTKISFKLNEKTVNDFRQDYDWDETNVPIRKAQRKLNEYLGFNVLLNWNYRKTIAYFLRTQQDYQDVFKLNKFKGKDRDWKPMVFDLLGFDGRILLDKADLEEKEEDLRNKIIILKNDAKIDTNERDKMQGLLDIKREEFQKVEDRIDRFNFYDDDKEFNRELVEEIDVEVQKLNSERYYMDSEIVKIEKALSNQVDEVDINKLAKIYEEVRIYFPDQLINNYEDLLEFNRSLTKERKKYLNENLDNLKKDVSMVNRRLSVLEERREDLLQLLIGKDVYKKFKSYQKDLAKLEAEILIIEERLQLIDQASMLERQIREIGYDLEMITNAIKEQIELKKHSEIRKTFNYIISNVLNVQAIISITQNKEGNVQFEANIQNPSSSEITAEDYGTTYRKLLCMAFDLSILIHYSDKSYFKFVYHDGALEGLDDRKKIKYINLVREICKQYNLQYIFTVIDSDLPRDENNTIIEFSTSDICLELHDRDDSGRLFGFGF